ncbi:MAG: PrgI family protein [Patescibacteria group bacterium]
MNFQVPQFIEVEDKIVGPLSFRQFLEVAGGAGLGYIFYTFYSIPLFIRLIPIILSLALGFALAFYRVNDRPLNLILESAFRYYLGSKLYIWKKSVESPTTKTVAPLATGVKIDLPKLSESRLKDLGWSLDIKEKVR